MEDSLLLKWVVKNEYACFNYLLGKPDTKPDRKRRRFFRSKKEEKYSSLFCNKLCICKIPSVYLKKWVTVTDISLFFERSGSSIFVTLNSNASQTSDFACTVCVLTDSANEPTAINNIIAVSSPHYPMLFCPATKTFFVFFSHAQNCYLPIH